MTARQKLFLVLALLAVFVPTVFQLMQCISAKNKLDASMMFRLPVTGYDPRDTVHGRYAMVAIDWQPDRIDPLCGPQSLVANNPKMLTRTPCGLCLKKINAEKTSVAVLPATALTVLQCDKSFRDLKAWWNDSPTRYQVADLNIGARIFLDERIADRVDKALREHIHRFAADIVFSDGKIVARELYIDGQPYQNFPESP